MPTVQEKMQSIIDKANGVTGKTDTDLTSATQSLVDGFGGGIPNITYLDAVCDTQIANAKQLTDWLLTVTSPKAVSIIYTDNLLNDAKANNTLGLVVVPRGQQFDMPLDDPQSGFLIRFRAGNWSRANFSNPQYDVIVNIGDVVHILSLEVAR